ncbi:VOC family protein [Fusibacter paucivorans]|uniref:Aldoketomutase n=1 Tax=Fusibacter paucivorans TaxID=76009 RepID=A0ABS5PPH2_9FIRM|nr:VOC family protein [Fusibacter paucivorans]MBS7526251.1 VOC family protein [Fusibacter paucivorans]
MYQIVHMCIRVMDLEKSLAFYRDAFGFEETRRKEFPEDAFSLVFISDADRNFEIELTYNYNPEKPYELGNGYSHLGIVVEDLEASHARHQAMGYEVTKLMGLPNQAPRFYFIDDPDGYSIEVIRK